MVDLKKFYAETQRCLKRERAENTTYDGLSAARAVSNVFISFNKGIEEFSSCLVNYWLETYILASKDISLEPTKEHIEWLASILTLIDGEFEAEQDFSKKDWEEIRDLVNSEAEELPLDILQNIITVLVDRKKYNS